jgi:hypothetical protein
VQTDSGDGSGYLVSERVVLTAAHVIFNDTKLSFSTGPISDAQLADFSATGVRWRFQRMRGESEPVPITARGSYVLRGYASSRQGVEPGQGTPQSQENDVATIYFNVPAGRGGFGGYLVSDASTEWTLSPRLKTFISYPLDPNYIQPPDRGECTRRLRPCSPSPNPTAPPATCIERTRLLAWLEAAAAHCV